MRHIAKHFTDGKTIDVIIVVRNFFKRHVNDSKETEG